MKSASNKAYHEGKSEPLVVFDVRIPGTVERFHNAWAAWGVHGDIEALDENRFVLIVQPGGTHGK